MGPWSITLPAQRIPTPLQKALRSLAVVAIMGAGFEYFLATVYFYASPPLEVLTHLKGGLALLGWVVRFILAILALGAAAMAFAPALGFLSSNVEAMGPVGLLAGLWVGFGPWVTRSRGGEGFGVALAFLGQMVLGSLAVALQRTNRPQAPVWFLLGGLGLLWVYLYAFGAWGMGLAWRGWPGCILWHLILWLGVGAVLRVWSEVLPE